MYAGQLKCEHSKNSFIFRLALESDLVFIFS